MPAAGLDPILEGVWGAATWPQATDFARAGLLSLGDIAPAYRQARDRKFDAFARLLQPYATGDVLDVGAGGPDLLERLSASTRIATDILPADRRAPGIGYVVQSRSDLLPFDDHAFDTVLMTGMAHHLVPDDRNRLLREVHRCLRPGGCAVLLEETFDDARGCGESSEPAMKPLSAQFDALSDADRLTFLAFTDWWGNRVMKGSDAIPLPMTFLSIREWASTLGDAHLAVTSTQLLGLMSGGGHLATPRALIVATRR